MFSRPWSRIAKASFVALGLLLLLLLVLPTLIGTKWIYQPLVDRLAADDFVVKLDGVRLGWFTPLRFRGIEIKQVDGPSLLTVDEINTDRGLLGYLLSGRRMGRIQIERPTVDVQLIEDSTNLERFIKAIEGRSPQQQEEAAREKLKIDVEVVIHGASAKVHRDSELPLVVIPPFDANVRYLGQRGQRG